jgi:DNA-binding NtrC family response regulator
MPGLLPSAPEPASAAVPKATVPAAADDPPTLAELEKRHILAALEHCRNNRTQAAKLLDISVRTLRNKLNEYQGSTGSGQAEAVGCSTDEDSEGDTAALPRHTRLPA